MFEGLNASPKFEESWNCTQKSRFLPPLENAVTRNTGPAFPHGHHLPEPPGTLSPLPCDPTNRHSAWLRIGTQGKLINETELHQAMEKHIGPKSERPEVGSDSS